MFLGSRGLRCLASLFGCAALMSSFGVAVAVTLTPWHVDPDSVGTLEGRLRSSGWRDPIVILSRDGWRLGEARVTPDGTFLLSRVPAGRHTLVVRGRNCLDAEMPVTVRVGRTDWIDVDLPCPPLPCPKLDRSDPGCIARSAEERAKVGSACQVHPKHRLRLDVVPIHFGIMSFQAAGDDHKQFPNARVVVSMGCVIGVERWAEVAYCRGCRAVFYWHNPRYLLQPIRPHEVRRNPD